MRRSGSLLAKCKLGVAVWTKVCGNKLLMCFLFVAGRSYQAARQKLFGLFAYIAVFQSRRAVKFHLPLQFSDPEALMSASDSYVAVNLFLILNFQLVFSLTSSSFREREKGRAVEQVKMVEAAGKKQCVLTK